MKLEDLRKQSTQELEEQLAKRQDELSDFMFDIRTKSIANVRTARHLRKEIARIKTIIRERELV